jgi:Cysteine rich repeat
MNQKHVVMILSLTMFAALAPKAWADPCDVDRIKICNDVTAGDGRVHDCLMGRKDRLTSDCAAALDRAEDLVAKVVDHCQPEAQRWCAQYGSSGRGRVVDCLKEHKEQIGHNCKQAYRQFKASGFDIHS